MKRLTRFKIWLLTKWADYLQLVMYGRDKCKMCLGHKNGMPGNENLVRLVTGKTITVCDHCSALIAMIE